jgi:hypothetical protein
MVYLLQNDDKKRHDPTPTVFDRVGFLTNESPGEPGYSLCSHPKPSDWALQK